VKFESEPSQFPYSIIPYSLDSHSLTKLSYFVSLAGPPLNTVDY